MKAIKDPARIDELLSRGVAEVVDRDHLKHRLMSGKTLRVKLGIDPTSPNLHLGRAVSLLKLSDFQKLGHRVVFVIGDFTGVVGDTSDKESERPMLTPTAVKSNLKTYIEQAGKLINVKKAEIHFNSTWLKKLKFSEIVELADIFSVAEFIARKNIKTRLERGSRVSLREMLYPLMQGYDSVQVKADVELGGKDQWFNLLAGRAMQESLGQSPQDVLTNNLILGTDGRKMSSSWGNTINFTDTSEDMFGKVMRIPDEQILAYFEHCTRVPMVEVMAFGKRLESGEANPRDIKLVLAQEITTLFHGKKPAERARTHFVQVVSRGELPDDVEERGVKSKYILEVLVELKFVSSKSEGRRMLSQGGVRVDSQTVTDPSFVLGSGMLVQCGKRKFVKIR